MEYYLAIKKRGILPFATAWMDLENIMLGEISQSEKEIPYDFTHMQSNEQTELTRKTQTDSYIESRMTAKGRAGRSGGGGLS